MIRHWLVVEAVVILLGLFQGTSHSKTLQRHCTLSARSRSHHWNWRSWTHCRCKHWLRAGQGTPHTNRGCKTSPKREGNPWPLLPHWGRASDPLSRRRLTHWSLQWRGAPQGTLMRHWTSRSRCQFRVSFSNISCSHGRLHLTLLDSTRKNDE